MPSINRKQFLEAIRFVSIVVPDRTPSPILQYAKLSVSEGKAKIVATDHDVRVGCKIDCDSDEITCLVPCKKISDLLSASNDEEFSVSLTTGGIKIVDSSGSYTLLTPPTDGFPIQNTKFEVDCKTDSIYLNRALPLITTCVNDKFKGKFVLDGVRFDTDGDKVVMVGTDEKRVCSCVIGDGQIEGFTLPMKAVRVVARMEGAISIGCRKGVATFLSDDKFVVSRTLQDCFPKFWGSIIEQGKDLPEWNGAVSDLEVALRKAAVFSAEETRGLDMVVDQRTTTILAKGADIGHSSIQIQGGSEKPIKLRFQGLDLCQFITKIPDVARAVTRIDQRIAMDVGDWCKFIMSTMED